MILVFAVLAVAGMGLLVVLLDQARPYYIDRTPPRWDLTGGRWWHR